MVWMASPTDMQKTRYQHPYLYPCFAIVAEGVPRFETLLAQLKPILGSETCN